MTESVIPVWTRVVFYVFIQPAMIVAQTASSIKKKLTGHDNG